MKQDKRVAIAIPADLNEKLTGLARLEGKTTAAFARKVLTEYVDSRSDVLEEALKANAAYQQSLEQIRGKYQ